MTVSFEEALFYEYFRLLMPDEEIVQGDHEQLAGKELDLWFPGKKLAVEVGSWFIHSQSPRADANKRRLAKRKGIHLVSVLTGKKEGMPKKNGTPLLAAPSPQSPDVIWSRHTIDRKASLTKFLQIAQPVCDALGLTYRAVPQEEWAPMHDRAIARCDTIPTGGAALVDVTAGASSGGSAKESSNGSVKGATNNPVSVKDLSRTHQGAASGVRQESSKGASKNDADNPVSVKDSSKSHKGAKANAGKQARANAGAQSNAVAGASANADAGAKTHANVNNGKALVPVGKSRAGKPIIEQIKPKKGAAQGNADSGAQANAGKQSPAKPADTVIDGGKQTKGTGANGHVVHVVISSHAEPAMGAGAGAQAGAAKAQRTRAKSKSAGAVNMNAGTVKHADTGAGQHAGVTNVNTGVTDKSAHASAVSANINEGTVKHAGASANAASVNAVNAVNAPKVGGSGQPAPGVAGTAGATDQAAAIAAALDNKLVASITGDWIVVFRTIAGKPATDRRAYAEGIIDRLFARAAGVEEWPQDIRDHATAMARRELGRVVDGTNSPASVVTPAVVHGLAAAYGVYLEHVATVSTMMDAMTRQFLSR